MNSKAPTYDPRTSAQKQLDEAAAAGDWTGFEIEELLTEEAAQQLLTQRRILQKMGSMITVSVHEQGLSTATQIARIQIGKVLSPYRAIAALNRAKVRFVLIGSYGLAGWLGARATEVIDVLVARPHVKRAGCALKKAFRNLEAEESIPVVRLRDRTNGRLVINLVRPLVQPYPEIFKHTVKVAAKGQKYRVPSLEMALAYKFAGMVDVFADAAWKFQDGHDFIVMVRQNPEIDLDKLRPLGELTFLGGGKAIVNWVERVRAGSKLSL